MVMLGVSPAMDGSIEFFLSAPSCFISVGCRSIHQAVRQLSHI
jgi:hypothetical protein